MKFMEEKIACWRNNDQVRLGVSVALGLIFLLLFAYTIYYFWGQARRAVDETIVEHITKLVEIFHEIDKECKILGFDQDKTPINFLNVQNFSGSEVGGMHLMYPEKWRGPYLESNLVVQGIHYYVLKTEQNVTYIVPGDGVRLGNGKVFGKDIIITKQTDIEALLSHDPALAYKGHPLIIPLPLESREQMLAKLRIKAYGAVLGE